MTDIPPPPPAPGVPPMGGAPAPNNNLVLAILTTVLCCLPLGIVGIVKAAEVNSKWAQGDFAGAQASADAAKKWSLWGIGSGAIVLVLYVILLAAGVLSASTY
ncbi:CD225/dispanin family protein [Demequina sp. NBRC 110052]|uniref:CD225/dispanin family protein n=1 Tax=Demequina sp. NBRC 110052 TaxID=1570341 RepID=UPI0009FD6FB4|nr:CD225/dispanin family protein [Demequina sp. NBRC 110052]